MGNLVTVHPKGEQDPVASYLEGLGIPVSTPLREELRRFAYRRFRKGAHFVRAGARAESIAFVLSGQVRHYYLLDGEEYTRWVALSGSFTVAFKSFVQQVPSYANLECTAPTELLVLDRATFFGLVERFDAMRRLWISSLETEMGRYEDRVTQFISADTSARYVDFVHHYPRHAREVPIKYIASILGVAPRHLSRVRAKLAAAQK